eukprot:scaffold248607_cov31-Tisochrysis_lutea.AAC.1
MMAARLAHRGNTGGAQRGRPGVGGVGSPRAGVRNRPEQTPWTAMVTQGTPHTGPKRRESGQGSPRGEREPGGKARRLTSDFAK